jgi:hypothetical protein
VNGPIGAGSGRRNKCFIDVNGVVPQGAFPFAVPFASDWRRLAGSLFSCHNLLATNNINIRRWSMQMMRYSG